MFLGDTVKEGKQIIKESGMKQKEIAAKIGISAIDFSIMLRTAHISKRYVQAMEVCGYDLEIKYIKRL